MRSALKRETTEREQQLNGGWGRKYQNRDSILGSQSKSSKMFFLSFFLNYSFKLISEYLCNHSQTTQTKFQIFQDSQHLLREMKIPKTKETVSGSLLYNYPSNAIDWVWTNQNSNCFNGIFPQAISSFITLLNSSYQKDQDIVLQFNNCTRLLLS